MGQLRKCRSLRSRRPTSSSLVETGMGSRRSLTSGTFLDYTGWHFYVQVCSMWVPAWVICVRSCRLIILDLPKLKARRAPLPRCADGCDSDLDDEGPGSEDLTECHPPSKWFVGPFPIHRHEIKSFLQVSGRILHPRTHQWNPHFR
jgi:hypothetical protein